MKKIIETILVILLAIILSPLLLIALIIYAFYKLILYIIEKPKYKNSNSYRISKIKYSHEYYKSIDFKINEELINNRSLVSINNDSKYTYFVGDNCYIYLSIPVLFERKDNKILISIDGDKPVEIPTALHAFLPNEKRKIYLIRFNSELINLNGSHIDVSSSEYIISGDNIADIVAKMSLLENHTL